MAALPATCLQAADRLDGGRESYIAGRKNDREASWRLPGGQPRPAVQSCTPVASSPLLDWKAVSRRHGVRCCCCSLRGLRLIGLQPDKETPVAVNDSEILPGAVERVDVVVVR